MGFWLILGDLPKPYLRDKNLLSWRTEQSPTREQSTSEKIQFESPLNHVGSEPLLWSGAHIRPHYSKPRTPLKSALTITRWYPGA
jgi:hypothetical protein